MKKKNLQDGPLVDSWGPFFNGRKFTCVSLVVKLQIFCHVQPYLPWGFMIQIWLAHIFQHGLVEKTTNQGYGDDISCLVNIIWDVIVISNSWIIWIMSHNQLADVFLGPAGEATLSPGWDGLGDQRCRCIAKSMAFVVPLPKKRTPGCLGLYAIGYRGLPRYVGIKKTTHHLKLTQQNQDFHIFKGWHSTQLYGDDFKNYGSKDLIIKITWLFRVYRKLYYPIIWGLQYTNVRISIKQPIFHGKYPAGFFERGSTG